MGEAIISRTLDNNEIEVVQETGNSTTDVMSQKAVTDELNNKVDKVEDKGLSSEDFTAKDKEKLDSTVPQTRKINSKSLSDDVFLTADDVGALPDTTVIPTKTSELENDKGFLTEFTETDPTVPGWAKAASKPTYKASEVGAIPTTDVVQELGTSTTKVMSQKAATDAIPTNLTDISGVLPIEKGGTGATTSGNALTNLGTVPIYTAVSSFISYPCTISELAQAMPSQSILMTWGDSRASSITDLPTSYGILTVHKRTSGRIQILYNRSYEGTVNGNYFYFGNYNTLSKTVTWNRIFINYSGCQVPLANGGTGSSNATNARTNLDVYSKSEVDQKIKDALPEVPSDQGAYILKAINGVLQWT